MARAAHPRAMAPARPGRTRTAPPRMPASWWSAPRIRTYLLFGATGLVYLLLGLLALRFAWALGSGPAAWDAALATLSHPLYLAFHGLALLAVLFVGVRFFALFPKAQPARLGPLRPPPRPLIQALLYALWGAVTLVLAGILCGRIAP